MKKQNDAILDVVSSSLDRIQRQLARDQTVQDGTQISSGISRAREQIEKQKPAKRVSSSTNSSGTGLLGSGRAPAAVSSSSRVTDVVLDMDDVEIPKAINKGKGTSSRSTKAVSKANVSDTARKSVRATKVSN